MRHSLRLFSLATLIVVGTIIYSSCKKTNSNSEDNNLTSEQIKSIASSTGKLHNSILTLVGKNYNLETIIGKDFKNQFYSVEVPNFNLHKNAPNHNFDFSGIYDYENFIDFTFKKSSLIEKDYLKSIARTIKDNSINEIGGKLDIILNSVLSNESISKSKKLALAGSIEVARNSSIFWNDARNNIENPYHVYFSSFNTFIKPPSCTEWADIFAYVDYYGYYSEGGYSPTQAATAAGQDASYASLIASQPGHSCGH